MATEQEKSLPSGESVWWLGSGALTGRGSQGNSDSGPDGAWASKGTGTKRTGDRSWPLGRLGAALYQAWPWPPSASPFLFLTHLRPQEGGPGSPGQSSGRANRTAGKQGKVAESLPPSPHSPQPPGKAELGQEFGAEVRKPWKGISQWMVEMENRRKTDPGTMSLVQAQGEVPGGRRSHRGVSGQPEGASQGVNSSQQGHGWRGRRVSRRL